MFFQTTLKATNWAFANPRIQPNSRPGSEKMFRKVEYPLGSKSCLGKWTACASSMQYFNRDKVSSLFQELDIYAIV